MAAIRSFRDLRVYQKAKEQAGVIFQLTRRFPREECYSLTDQIRRSSRAVGALIAEGWGRRRYQAAFINKMSEAISEALETQAWLDHAVDCGYLTSETHSELDQEWCHVGGMLQRMIDSADKFCNSAGAR